jgi:phosphoribosylanthranilate isomerase
MTTGRKPWLKVCGITCIEDAELAVRAGADAIGLNLVASSKRRVELARAREIADSVRGKIEIVGVVADRSRAELLELSREAGFDALQLHGMEPPAALVDLPTAFKALGIETAADVERARTYPGSRLLLDATSRGKSGGTGAVFDWSLVVELCRTRAVILAGGLSPDNVGEAIARLSLYGVDVASGVERSADPRRKDPDKVHAFVERARRAADEGR